MEGKGKILLLLTTLLAATASARLNNEACNYKLFPNFAGGSNDETIKCFVYDPVSKYIIVGGTSTSSDFAPAEN